MSNAKPLIWITGASGFLGSHVGAYFADRNWRVVGISRDTHQPALFPNAAFEEWADCGVESNGLETLIDRFGVPRAVFHAAGGSSVSLSLESPLTDFVNTVTTTAMVLDVLRRKAPNTIFALASSAAVYGICPKGPIGEDDPTEPVSPYGLHKRMAEQLCQQAAHLFGQPTISIRYFSIYGPGLRKQVLWDLSQRIASGTNTISLFGTGEETRDFLHARDAASLTYTAITSNPTGFLLVNGGSGKSVTMKRISELMADAFNANINVSFSGITRPGDPSHYCADVRLAKQLGFSPTISLADGIREYATWFRKQFRDEAT